MESRVNYALVGLFVLLLTGAVLAAIVWLLLGGESKLYDLYRVYTTESVAGLNPKAAVKYKGVDVGRVAAVELDADNPERIDILLEIERGTPVKTDTKAILVTQGLTGLTTIELTGGTRDAPLLQAAGDQAFPVIDSGPSLIARLDDTFTTIAAQLDGLVGRVEALLSEANQQALSQTLANINTISHAIATHADSLGQGLESAAQVFDNSARISTEMTPLLAKLNESLATLDATAVAITQTSKTLDSAVKESRRDLLQIANQTAPEVTALVAELRQFTAGLQRLGKELERDPRALLFGKQPGQPGPGE